MQLTYRGVTYQNTAAQNKADTVERTATYRGVQFKLEQKFAEGSHVNDKAIKYRGATLG